MQLEPMGWSDMTVRNSAIILRLMTLLWVSLLLCDGSARAGQEPFVIAGSPSVKGVIDRLGAGFERTHPDVRMKLYVDSGLDLRRTIAGMENSMVGQYFIGSGPIHIVAPGGDEVLNRLEQKYSVLPGTKQSYAVEHLVLVVPESLVDAPDSLEVLSRGTSRLAVADPLHTRLGAQTDAMLHALGLDPVFKARLVVATDSRGVLDHVLSGQADAGILFGHEAVTAQERVRVVAKLEKGYPQTVHSMAMERYCPNRSLCEEFLGYLHSAEAQAIVREAGYGVPAGRRP